jgi:hypothetical protein
MVAYSFQKRFVEPILAGTKCQTIRADRRRHARPDEELQLYTGMRTRQCKLICRAVCEEVLPIVLCFGDGSDEWVSFRSLTFRTSIALDHFALRDGFADWSDLKAFWREQHPGVDRFEGVLISWSPLSIVADRP